MSQALTGLRVIDFTQVLAGPFATQQLAQLGADVIKVEQPGVGDMTRAGLVAAEAGNVSPSFNTCNIGKRSITVDLKSAAGIDIVQRLVATADAVVENFRPGVMDRLGLGYEALKTIREDLVYCSISGYGQDGPTSERPAFDGAIQASSGMMSITGHPDVGPMRTGFFAVDMATALNGAFVITAALLRRMRTGMGQRVDVAMQDTALMMIAPQMSAYLAKGIIPELFGNRSPTRQPTANVFPTSDGYLQVVGLRDSHCDKLYDVLEIADFAERFPTAKDRVENYEEISNALHSRLASQTTRHWHDALLAAGVPVSEVRSLDEVAADPQFDHRLAIAELPAATGSDERVKTVSASHIADTDGPEVQRPAPGLGEHTSELLRSIGFDDKRIDGLRKDGVI